MNKNPMAVLENSDLEGRDYEMVREMLGGIVSERDALRGSMNRLHARLCSADNCILDGDHCTGGTTQEAGA